MLLNQENAQRLSVNLKQDKGSNHMSMLNITVIYPTIGCNQELCCRFIKGKKNQFTILYNEVFIWAFGLS